MAKLSGVKNRQRQKQIPFGDDNQRDNGKKKTTASVEMTFSSSVE
jgi:hypothetical protein